MNVQRTVTNQCNLHCFATLLLYLVSREVIIGTSVTAGLLLGGIFLLLITTGSVKIGRRFRTFVQQKAKQRRE